MQRIDTYSKIQKFVQQLVLKFNPEKIILFGSFAYGRPSKSSDVDLLVIMKTNLRPIEQEVAIRKAISRNFPLDLIVFTPSQLREREKMGDFFIKTILEKGKYFMKKITQEWIEKVEGDWICGLWFDELGLVNSIIRWA